MQISGNVIKILSWNIKEIFCRCQGARVPSLGSPRDTWYLEEWCRHSGAPDTQQPITLSARHRSFHKKSDPTIFWPVSNIQTFSNLDQGNTRNGLMQSFQKTGIGLTQQGAQPTPHILHASFLEWDGRDESFSFAANPAKLIGSVRQDYAITLSHGQLPELTQDLCAHAATAGLDNLPTKCASCKLKVKKLLCCWISFHQLNHNSSATIFLSLFWNRRI